MTESISYNLVNLSFRLNDTWYPGRMIETFSSNGSYTGVSEIFENNALDIDGDGITGEGYLPYRTDDVQRSPDQQ